MGSACFLAPLIGKAVLGHPSPFPNPNPEPGSRSPRPPPRFLLGKMEVVGTCGPGPQRFAARCRPAPLAARPDPPSSPALRLARLAGAGAPPFLLVTRAAGCPEFGAPEGVPEVAGAAGWEHRPRPSGFLPAGFLPPWPLASPPARAAAAGRKGLCQALGRRRGALLPPRFFRGASLGAGVES